MEKYIYEKRFSLSDELCDEIINNLNILLKYNYVNKQNEKCYYHSLDSNSYIELIQTINNELETALNNLKTLNDDLSKIHLFFNDYKVVKFEQNTDYISYFYDFKVLPDNVYTEFEFIFFLNSVKTGGEVEIIGKINIMPEKGKLLIFPSGWCFPYSHKMPMSDNKYIIIGKIFKTIR